MKNNLDQYKFTNGTRVADWLDTLPADDRERATECILQLIDERQPLNQLQVKIRMSEPKPEIPPEIADEIRPDTAPENDTPKEEAKTESSSNYYYAPQPQPQPQPFQQQVAHTQRKNHNWLVATIIGLIIVCIAAFALNPSYNDHKQIMSDVITHSATQLLNEELSKNSILSSGFGNMLGSMIGNMMIGNIIQYFIDNSLQYHNYLLFSTCTVNTDEGDKTVSFGIFGKVFTFDENDIRDAMKKGIEGDSDIENFDIAL